jgi:CHAD domain-containing protein
MEIFDPDSKEPLSDDIPLQLTIEPDAELIAAVDSARNSNDRPTFVEKLPYPAVQKSIGIQPDDNLAEAGKKVWLYHFAIMLSHEQGTLLGEDVEELHDMRVATRRMRSAFEIFGEAFEPKIMRRYLKGLRNIGQALGQVRDMDVILGNGLVYQEKLGELQRPSLDPLLTSWRQEIDSKRIKLTKHLQSETYQKFTSEFNKFLQTPEVIKDSNRPGIETTSRIRDIVPVLVYNRYAKVRAYESILPTATITQLHALRIEFKKFRYTLEYFKEILDSNAVALINEIKRYQDHLGELHDADVACQLVRGFLKTWEADQTETPIPERVNPEQIVIYLAYLHSERYRLMISFPEIWMKFNRPEFRQNMAQAISLL